MSIFEPLINLIVLLSILSIAAERATNIIKLNNKDTRNKPNNADAIRVREQKINNRLTYTSIFLAVIMKANFFEIIANLKDPWQSFGWIRFEDYQWLISPALDNWGSFLIALAGCIITGIGMGFGSKFWHDILNLIYEIKEKKLLANK